MTSPTDQGGTLSIEADLTELVMNCPELAQLEAQLAQFNIFRILRADRNELRHSNMLAWLFAPEESHGLGSLFLRRWLMLVLRRAGGASMLGLPSPLAVDVLDIDHIDVHRELENIDLLFTIQTSPDAAGKADSWIVCIENKVGARQGVEQLKRYHTLVEKRFPHARYRIYVFLTRDDEPPAHPVFIESSYRDILSILDACLEERADAIGREPRLLMDHYRQLLVDDFMEETEAGRLARQIYLRHRRALDFIFEYRVDPVYEATEALQEALTAKQKDLGIVMYRTDKGYVRFVPQEWDVPQNTGGTGWGKNSRYLVCELYFWGKRPELQITAGHAPEVWAERLWEQAKEPPFKQEWKKRPQQYVKPFKAKASITMEKLFGLDREGIVAEILPWLEGELKSATFKNAVTILANMLQDLRAE